MTDHASTPTAPAPRPAAARPQQPVDEKIDAFCHILPRTCADRLFALDDVPALANLRRRVMDIPALVDLDVRFRQMDEFPGYRQLINLAAPPAEDFGTPRSAAHHVRMANDALADLTARHPDRFAGFCAGVARAAGAGAGAEVGEGE
ncbi:hypothetical protein ACFVZ2_28840, partial [Streptomyces lasiicapitis]